jgi:DinB superfamily
MTADEVREHIESSWRELDELVGGLDEAALTAPGDNGWAVKDHLVHVGAWERWLQALFEGKDLLVAMGAGGAKRKVDDINAVVFDKHRGDSPQQAREYFRASHRDLMAILGPMTTRDFERPYRTFFAQGEEADEQPVLVAVAGNTYDHYAEHVQWISEMRGKRAPR